MSERNNLTRPLWDCQVGDTVTYGRYCQTNSHEKTPITWKVLDVQQGTALLLANDCLIAGGYCDAKEIQRNSSFLRWQNCWARRKCYEFYKEAFFGVERQFLTSRVVLDNPQEGGVLDFVFLLSEEEVMRYMPAEVQRKALITEYAVEKGARKYNAGVYGGSACWWILPEYDKAGQQYYPKAVLMNGEIQYHGRNIYHEDWTIRPCIQLDLSLLKKAMDKQEPVQIKMGDISKFTGDGIVNAAHYSGSHVDQLYWESCYLEALDAAREKGQHSVELPSISMGAYGDVLEKAAESAMGAVMKWLAKNTDWNMQVSVVCGSERTQRVYEKAYHNQRYYYLQGPSGLIQKMDELRHTVYVLNEWNMWDIGPAGLYTELAWGSLPTNRIDFEDNYETLTIQQVLKENAAQGQQESAAAQEVYEVSEEVDQAFRRYCEKYYLLMQLLYEDQELNQWCRAYGGHQKVSSHESLQRMLTMFMEEGLQLPFFQEYLQLGYKAGAPKQVQAGQKQQIITALCMALRMEAKKCGTLITNIIPDGTLWKWMDLYLK